ncbi:hypothetical protein GGF50DRAFT_45197 [Schizophyllum commune]
MIQLNRMQCLRITERCANILISVRDEVVEATQHDNGIPADLEYPLRRLVDAFAQIQAFLNQQAHRPFIKRYLKRDDILRQLQGCDAALQDAVDAFGFSVQFRIYRYVRMLDADRRGRIEGAAAATVDRLLEGGARPLLEGGNGHPTNALGLENTASAGSDTTPRMDTTPTMPETATLGATAPAQPAAARLRARRARENAEDTRRDVADLRGVMRKAMEIPNDAALMRVLEVDGAEIPEAVRALQRALEGALRKVEGEKAGLSRDGSLAEKGGAASRRQSKRRSGDDYAEEEQDPDPYAAHDMLDREFMESGIDAMRRMSRPGGQSSMLQPWDLPDWTITRYEIDREIKIGVGYFSDVYKGTWKGRAVAIKVLAPTTPRKLFVREAGIWRGLRHRNVLQLFGASSAVEGGMWFLVSPYLPNGTLVEYLKRVESRIAAGLEGPGSPRLGGQGSPRLGATSPRRSTAGHAKLATSPGSPIMEAGTDEDPADVLRYLLEIARGMEYLHSKGVLHGDLKAANVLVDDNHHAVISDFGQSEMRSEVYRISGLGDGTLRWQAPELLSGATERITTETDVYAFAITAVEVLGFGRLPWGQLDDEAVRWAVLSTIIHAIIPSHTTPVLLALLRACWARDPFKRPMFSQVVRDVKRLRKQAGWIERSEDKTSEQPPDALTNEEMIASMPSPDLKPMPLPGGMSPRTETGLLREAGVIGGPPMHMPEPVLYTSSSRASSLFMHDEEGGADYAGYESPPPATEMLAEIKNERRYRLLLNHEYHPSLNLPLWTPTPVEVGAVGYLSKPSGRFVTLFNAFAPDHAEEESIRGLPSVSGYGTWRVGVQQVEKRGIAQRGLDAIVGFLTYKSRGGGASSESISRRYSYPLRSGHKVAYLCTETATYRYLYSADAAKRWFVNNVDAVVRAYGRDHHIGKEDLFFVVGTLDAPDHALFVSHVHPDGQAHFNVYASSVQGQPWGRFTMDTAPDVAGPSYDTDDPQKSVTASKVSGSGDPPRTVLLARLRFKPDEKEPTTKL